MRAVIQRVKEASVHIDGQEHASIKQGLLILVGFEPSDNHNDIELATKKITQLRIFADNKGLMNKSVMDVQGELLIVSQFTLFGDTRKGNRPSFVKAAPPDIAIPLYNVFIDSCIDAIGENAVKTGQFGANMAVSLINDGPVTIWMNTKLTHNDNQ